MSARLPVFGVKCLIQCLLAALLLTSCATTKVPMDYLSYNGPASDHRTLVIALRGLGGSNEDFERYAFVAALQDAYPDFDLIAPDAHFGYYRERSLLTRLNEDIISPASARGYRRFYLVGVSMGGLGSLLALREHPDRYDGVVLLSPYSGEPSLHAALAAYLAGQGPAPWTMEWDDRDQHLTELWRWLLDNRPLLESGKVWLGYGDSDRLSGHPLLASLLPDNRVVTLEGGHRAAIFAQLWREILNRSAFED